MSLADGREFDATLIGADPNNDIAVLRVETDEKLPWIPPGTSADLMVGEPVIAIGNPFGLSHTVTTGVDLRARPLDPRERASTTASSRPTPRSIPGNSGGPLLNAEGELIAINTAVYNRAQGIGFAIPIDVASRVVSELIEHGEVSPVWLGLEFQDLTPELRAGAGAARAARAGAGRSRVREDSPAARAGVQRGDVVTQLDGRPIAAAADFFERLAGATDGQELRVDLLRQGRGALVRDARRGGSRRRGAQILREQLGIELAPAEQGGFAVRAVREGSGAARIGVQPGDLLLGINGRAARGRRGAAALGARPLRGESRALIVVQRGAGRYHVTIPLA